MREQKNPKQRHSVCLTFLGLVSLLLVALPGCKKNPRSLSSQDTPSRANTLSPTAEIDEGDAGRESFFGAKPAEAFTYTLHLNDFGLRSIGILSGNNNFQSDGKPQSVGHMKFYCEPLMMVKRDAAGELSVSVQDSTTVRIVLAADSQGGIRKLALDDLKHRDIPGEEYLHQLGDNNFDPINATRIEVYESDAKGRNKIGPNKVGIEGDEFTITIPFNTSNEANEWVDRFKKGLITLEVAIGYPGVITNSAIVTITVESLENTKTWKDLHSDNVKIVDRREFGRMVSEAIQNEGITIMHPENMDSFKYFDKLVDQAISHFSEQKITLALKAETLAKKFAEVGIDPHDLRADIVDSLDQHFSSQDGNRNYFKQWSDNQFDVSTSGGFDYMDLISGDASLATKSHQVHDLVTDVLRQHDVEYDEQKKAGTNGYIIVPRTIGVVSMDDEIWTRLGEILINKESVTRDSYGWDVIGITVSGQDSTVSEAKLAKLAKVQDFLDDHQKWVAEAADHEKEIEGDYKQKLDNYNRVQALLMEEKKTGELIVGPGGGQANHGDLDEIGNDVKIVAIVPWPGDYADNFSLKVGTDIDHCDDLPKSTFNPDVHDGVPRGHAAEAIKLAHDEYITGYKWAGNLHSDHWLFLTNTGRIIDIRGTKSGDIAGLIKKPNDSFVTFGNDWELCAGHARGGLTLDAFQGVFRRHVSDDDRKYMVKPTPPDLRPEPKLGEFLGQ